MLVAEVVLVVVVVGYLFWLRRYVDRVLLAHAAARQKALDGRVKAVSTDSQRALAEAGRALKDARHALDDVALTQRRVEAHMSDPRLKRVLGG